MGPPAFAGGNLPYLPTLAISASASMGPPAFAGGNASASPQITQQSSKLQWGHRLSPVETCRTCRRWQSQRPLQWGHRLSPVETPARLRRLPSSRRSFNGATGFRRWKQRHPIVVGRKSVASMGPPAFAGGNPSNPASSESARPRLQWGHRLSPVETSTVGLRRLTSVQASMGPPAFAGGNPSATRTG